MKVTIEFDDPDEASNAINAWKMLTAANEFDQKLRAILKYDTEHNRPEGYYEAVETLREMHRHCWDEQDVKFS